MFCIHEELQPLKRIIFHTWCKELRFLIFKLDRLNILNFCRISNKIVHSLFTLILFCVGNTFFFCWLGRLHALLKRLKLGYCYVATQIIYYNWPDFNNIFIREVSKSLFSIYSHVALVLRGDDFITGDCIVQTQHFKYVTFKCRFLLLSPGFKHLLVPVKMRRFNLPWWGSKYYMVYWTRV
jgi:hypothetical protein